MSRARLSSKRLSSHATRHSSTIERFDDKSKGRRLSTSTTRLTSKCLHSSVATLNSTRHDQKADDIATVTTDSSRTQSAVGHDDERRIASRQVACASHESGPTTTTRLDNNDELTRAPPTTTAARSRRSRVGPIKLSRVTSPGRLSTFDECRSAAADCRACGRDESRDSSNAGHLLQHSSLAYAPPPHDHHDADDNDGSTIACSTIRTMSVEGRMWSRMAIRVYDSRIDELIVRRPSGATTCRWRKSRRWATRGDEGRRVRRQSSVLKAAF